MSVSFKVLVTLLTVLVLTKSAYDTKIAK